MQDRHQNRNQYFHEQAQTTRKFVIPFVSEFIHFDTSTRVLEIGCGEGGNLLPFAEIGAECVGIDLNSRKIQLAQQFFQEEDIKSKPQFILQNIYDTNPEDFGQFDFIFLRDVIEHIPEQEKFMGFLKDFIKPEGKIFFGFPPWWMPFGGHQQTCKSILSKVPYFHLLPNPLYKGLLSAFGEPQLKIQSLMETKSTGILLERFESILKVHNYQIDKKQYYLINPNYETKFGLQPRKQLPILDSIPYLRNFYTTCGYYVVSTQPRAVRRQ